MPAPRLSRWLLKWQPARQPLPPRQCRRFLMQSTPSRSRVVHGGIRGRRPPRCVRRVCRSPGCRGPVGATPVTYTEPCRYASVPPVGRHTSAAAGRAATVATWSLPFPRRCPPFRPLFPPLSSHNAGFCTGAVGRVTHGRGFAGEYAGLPPRYHAAPIAAGPPPSLRPSAPPDTARLIPRPTRLARSSPRNGSRQPRPGRPHRVPGAADRASKAVTLTCS